MSKFPVAAVIELIGESPNSWEEAVQKVVEEASKTVHHITGVEILNLTADVENGRVVRYVADCHVAFGVDNNLREAKMRARDQRVLAGVGALEVSGE